MTEKSIRRTAIVIGAGIGGVATAARLAKAGFEVTVLEKNGYTGGRCSLIQYEGYRFDQGPSLLLLPKLFRETFQDLDTSLEAEDVELLKCNPNYNLWFGDGERFELSSDMAVMKREIEKWEGKAGFQRYLAWLSEAHAHYEISVVEVLHRNFTTIFNLLRWRFLKAVFQLHPFESIYSRASKYFYTERLRRVFTFGSMYMGMSPFDAPGTYSLLQYTELAEGIWYPVGGFHAIVAALVGIGQRFGVTYRLNTSVSNVLTTPDGKTASGVLLSSGETLVADIIVINADLVYAYNNLFNPPSITKLNRTTKTSNFIHPPSSTSYAKTLSARAGSCSSISFYWALSRQVPELNTHNIFLADEYKESFDAIFKRQSIPADPSFYVNVPSRVDRSAAPEGCDSIVVLVPVGHLLKSRLSSNPDDLSTGSEGADSGAGMESEQDWQQIISFAREKVQKTIETRTGCAKLTPLIAHEILNDPLSWESRFNLDKGSILGLSHSFFNVLAFRPSIKHKTLRNAYFVGASTHPGTGVPIVLAGAKMTSEVILEDSGIHVPWARWEADGGKYAMNDLGVGQDAKTRSIDRVRNIEYGLWALAGTAGLLFGLLVLFGLRYWDLYYLVYDI